MDSSDPFEKVFSHDRLDVYRIAVEFAGWVNGATRHLPGGRAGLQDQITRASESIVLNIAEGAQQRTRAMANKHYRIAFASAAECAAAIDLMDIRHIQGTSEGRSLFRRIGAMLHKLVR